MNTSIYKGLPKNYRFFNKSLACPHCNSGFPLQISTSIIPQFPVVPKTERDFGTHFARMPEDESNIFWKQTEHIMLSANWLDAHIKNENENYRELLSMSTLIEQ